MKKCAHTCMHTLTQGFIIITNPLLCWFRREEEDLWHIWQLHPQFNRYWKWPPARFPQYNTHFTILKTVFFSFCSYEKREKSPPWYEQLSPLFTHTWIAIKLILSSFPPWSGRVRTFVLQGIGLAGRGGSNLLQFRIWWKTYEMRGRGDLYQCRISASPCFVQEVYGVIPL